MSQNNITTAIIYTGIDIAKATLELNLGDAIHNFANEAKDHARILKLLAAPEKAAGPGTKVHVILEATGGYEAVLVRALHGAGVLVSVIQPSRVRHFAYAKNQRAKDRPNRRQDSHRLWPSHSARTQRPAQRRADSSE